MAPPETRAILLSEAENLIRTQGYAAFSYADLSERVGIRKTSIHHHFPTKEALGSALIESYLERFVFELEALAEKPIDAKVKLLTYGNFFADGLRDGLMPLCGALASDAAELPLSMQRQVKKFFKIHLHWLESVLNEGVAKRELTAGIDVGRSAVMLLSTLQGASLVAWALKEPSVIKPAYKQAVETLAR